MSASVSEPILLLDPSEFRPEHKKDTDFRDFRIHNVPDRVVDTYRMMHTHQTLEFATNKLKQWTEFNHAEMTLMEAIEALNGLVDESDPDVDFPNSLHAFQTAEAIRKVHPTKEWFQVTGLIHDLGKMMALWGEPQWAVVGDTFPVGCRPDESIVFGLDSFAHNADINNEKLNTRLGIYKENCGLENVTMSWGHDEYLYRVLKANGCTIPDEGLYMIRFHSFYPWHSSGAYRYLCDNRDLEMLKWVNEFNQFDLYTKSPDLPDMDTLMPYYTDLINKFCPGKLRW